MSNQVDNKTRNHEIAVGILEQLGNGRFLALTGASLLVAIDNGLQFKLPEDEGFVKDGINTVQVILDSMDTYTVKFGTVDLLAGNPFEWVKREHTGIYAEMLKDIFESETGLYVTLNARKG